MKVLTFNKNNFFRGFVILPIVAIIAIGRLYDERLGIISSITTIFYMIAINSSLLLKKRLVNGSGLFFFLIFSSFLLMSLIISFSNNEDTFGNSETLEKLSVFFFITFPIFLFMLFNKDEKILDFFFKFLFLVTIVLFFSSVQSFITSGGGERTTTLGGGPITLARWLFYGIFFMFFYVEKKYFLLKGLMIAGMLFICLSTGSRGPILIFSLTVLIYSFLTLRKNSLYLNILIFSFLLLTAYNFVSIVEYFKFDAAKRLLTLSDVESLSTSTSSLSRLNRYWGSLEMSKDYLFTGVGLGSWGNYILDYVHMPHHEFVNQGKYPHNIFLEILTEMGLFATLSFVVLIVLSYRNLIALINSNKTNNKYQFIFLILTYSLLNAQISGDLSDARLLFILISIALTLK